MLSVLWALGLGQPKPVYIVSFISGIIGRKYFFFF